MKSSIKFLVLAFIAALSFSSCGVERIDAGHEGIKVHKIAVLHLHPFGVAAGQADQAVVELRETLHYPQHLGFFAAHHIGQG